MSRKRGGWEATYGDLTGREFEDEVRRFEAFMPLSKHGAARIIATLYSWMGVERLRQMNDYFEVFGI